MKHTSLFVGLFMAAASAVAQPVLVNSTVSPVPGDKFYQHDCDAFGVTSGASGAGVVWDFSTLSQLSLDSLEYGPCAGTPYCDSFPGSSLSVNYGGGYYEYYMADTSQFAQTGDGDAFSLDHYPDPLAVIKYPMGYGPAFKSVDTMSIANFRDGYYGGGTDTLEGDGYGTLILPSGTYSDVLRVRMMVAVTDTDISTTPATIDTEVAELYLWWTPGFHNPLLIMSYDTADGGTLQSVAYFTRPKPVLVPSITKNAATGEPGINVYPNPVRDYIHVQFTTDDAQPITIMLTDIAGRKTGTPVEYNAVRGLNDLNYPVASLPAGMYIMHIQTASGVITRKVEVAG